MAVFNCKSCGGDLEIQDGATVVTCEYCGRQQTVPSADSEKKVNLFNRANRLRSKCDFDKAASVYESIVAEFPAEAEAYWGLCLCKFGIEYVDDPATANKIPTCHRTSYESIFDDPNFDQACENADALAVNVYRSEAKEIDRLQKEILEIAKNEQPFDVFICYKESDELGGRTVDSELAHDIYDVLTEKGYKVFYSRITLKSKLGQDYEPYIFSALNSAKVMLSIGTKYEYFNAVWVKNEWSRFLSLMKSDKSKMLIPCYRDIDPYDMPKEFNGLQGQDLSSPRAFQDLVTNIERIIPRASVQSVSTAAASSADPILKRAFLCLEDGDWNGADKCCEKILDMDPENARVYLVKLCLELKINRPSDLANNEQPLEDLGNFKKAIRFADDTFRKELESYNNAILEHIETERKNEIYNEAVSKMSAAASPMDFTAVRELFQTISGFKDADELAEKCSDQEVLKDAWWYGEAVKKMDGAVTVNDFDAARKMFKNIKGFKDANKLAKKCDEQIYGIAYDFSRKMMEEAVNRSDSADFSDAKALSFSLRQNTDYIVEKYNDYIYHIACGLMEKAASRSNCNDYREARKYFKLINSFKDADELAEKCNEQIYLIAFDLMKQSESKSRISEITDILRSLDGYKDSEQLAAQIENGDLEYYNKAKVAVRNNDFSRAEQFLGYAGDFFDAPDLVQCCKNVIKQNGRKDSEDLKALQSFAKVAGGFNRSALKAQMPEDPVKQPAAPKTEPADPETELSETAQTAQLPEELVSAEKNIYDKAVAIFNEGDYQAAENLFKKIPKYKDTSERLGLLESITEFSEGCNNIKEAHEKRLSQAYEAAVRAEDGSKIARSVLLSCVVWASYFLMYLLCFLFAPITLLDYLVLLAFPCAIASIVIPVKHKTSWRAVPPTVGILIAAGLGVTGGINPFHPALIFAAFAVFVVTAVIYQMKSRPFTNSVRECYGIVNSMFSGINKFASEKKDVPDNIKKAEIEKILSKERRNGNGYLYEQLESSDHSALFGADMVLFAANIILALIIVIIPMVKYSGRNNETSGNGSSYSDHSRGQSDVKASADKASQWGHDLLNINGAYTFYDMTVANTFEDVKKYCKINPGNCEDYFFAYNHDYSAYSEVLIVKPKTGKNVVQSFKSEFYNYFDYVKNVMETPVFSKATLSVGGAVHGVTDDGYYYMIVHEDGAEIAAQVFGSSSIVSERVKAAADYSILNDLLYTRVRDIMSQSTIEDSDRYSDNMTYKGYYISITPDRYGGMGSYEDRLPRAMSFPINMIVSGDCDYTYAGLKEVFGDKLVLTSYPAAENPYGVDAYGMKIKWDFDITLYNESGEEYFDTDLTGRVKSCWLDCGSLRERFKPDASQVVKILTSTIGKLKSECTNITNTMYGYNMTYHGTEIYVSGGTTNRNDIDRNYPRELEFPIEFLIKGKKDYSWAELWEIFQNDLATDSEHDPNTGITTYRVSARVEGFLIFFINDSCYGGIELGNTNLPFNKCRYYYY